MSISFDFSEVEKLAASLSSVERVIPREVRQVVSKGLLNIKTEARESVSTHPRWKRLAATINYTMFGNAAISSGEVGYDDVGQGELAGIAEFGSARHAPHPALMPAAKAEAPRFEKAILDAAAKAIGDAL